MIPRLSAAVAGILALLVVVGAAVVGVLGLSPANVACEPTALPTAVGTLPLDAEQTVNATTILEVANRRALPARAPIVAIATALQESRLRNLPYGHADSLGLFQQRPSQDWGSTPAGPADHRTRAQRVTDPDYAATAFYTAMLAVPGWQQLRLSQVAQAVQRSAHPAAYARWESLATRTVKDLSARACSDSLADPTTAAGVALAYARAQLGLPYEWGGDGPTYGDVGFDCSGLAKAAYAAASVALPRTAQTQYEAGPALPAGSAPASGDLVFFGAGPNHITHVGLVTGNGYMIDAPHRGAVVRLERIWRHNMIGFTRPGP